MNETLDDTKKRTVLDALNSAGWNYGTAAKTLNISRQGLHQMAQRYGFIRLKTVRTKRWVRV